ncbi:S8 family serine peptidase [Aquiflexum sp.]|uniref:S8 family serine peptidase n=1 Tax=Aquiflexum sp. TaxID=1872584 RepID=UPI003593A0B8
MKTLIYLLILGFLSLVFSTNYNREILDSFYYAYDEKVFLTELEDKIIIQFKTNQNSDNKFLVSQFPIIKEKDISWRDDSTVVLKIQTSERLNLQEELRKSKDVLLTNSMYISQRGSELGFTDRFIISLKNNVSKRDLEKLNAEHKVEIHKTTEYYFVLKVPPGEDALSMANKYFESGLTIYSHPDFYVDFVMHQSANDPYFNNQFYLHNTGQIIADGRTGIEDADIDAPEAWTVTTGSQNIIVAVLDDGVTSNHVDLPNTRQVRLNGSNFADGNANNPSPTGNMNHGNSCAGIIGATRNNNVGISGVAPGVRIMPIRIQNSDESFAPTSSIANAFDFARNNGAHIMSNSWGTRFEESPNFIPSIREAIFRATTQGRGGLGSIVVFAAGNSAHHAAPVPNPGFVSFPANVTVPGVLTVGASDRDDFQANYSPTSDPGSPNNQIIDIVAPSHRAYSDQIPNETFEVYTIDIPGTPGYNPVKSTDGGPLPVVGSVLPNTGPQPHDFTARFGGTSAACPQVAAAAALILSIRPGLTQMEVFNILTQTADEVEGYVYTNGRSNELGFGRLNVCRALSGAVNIHGNSLICTTGGFSAGTLPTGSTVSWVSSNPSGLTINSSTGSATRVNNYNGPITVTANIINGCGTASSSRMVWVGTPHITNMRVNNQPVFPSQSVSLCPGNHWLNVTPVGGNAGTATWTVPPSVPHWIGNNTMDFTFEPNVSSIAISTRSSNSCGQGANYNFFLTRQGWNCPSSFAVVAYPNPTNHILNIEMMPVTAEASKDDAPHIESAILLNSDGKEVSKSYREGSKIVFDVSHLKKGVYFIHVTVDGELIREQILIE